MNSFQSGVSRFVAISPNGRPTSVGIRSNMRCAASVKRLHLLGCRWRIDSLFNNKVVVLNLFEGHQTGDWRRTIKNNDGLTLSNARQVRAKMSFEVSDLDFLHDQYWSLLV